MAEFLMGAWDCSSCNTKGVRGDAYDCHGCGAGRPYNVKFYLPSNAEKITDAQGLREAKAGTDWKCDYCGQWITATIKKCPDCSGGDIDKSERQKTKVVRDTAIGGRLKVVPGPHIIPAGLGAALQEQEKLKKLDTPSYKHMALAAKPRRRLPQRKSIIGIFLAMLAVCGLSGGGYLLFRTKEILVEVTAHHWERGQKVEEFKTGLNRDGWDHPSDAYNISTSRRVHHHVRVLDHYETKTRQVSERVRTGSRPVYNTRTVSLGNGRFRTERYQSGTEPVYTTRYRTETYRDPVYRQDPVYRTYYHFKVDRWVNVNSRVNQGLGLEAKWPSTEIQHDKQRMGGRWQEYQLYFQTIVDPGEETETYTVPIPEGQWWDYKDGEILIAEISVASGVKNIRRIEAEIGVE